MPDVTVIEEFNHFAQYADGLGDFARQAVNATIHRIEARAKISLGGARTGKTYKRGAIKSQRKADKGEVIGYEFHRASAPGEAPATDTGDLAVSIHSRMIGPTTGEVTVSAEYAVVLELGGVRMAPRPYFAPAVKAEWPEFLRAMHQVGE